MYISGLHDYEHDEDPKAMEFIALGRKKEIKDEIESLIEDEFDRLEDFASNHISQLAADRAENYLVKVLAGDDDAAMALLGSKNNGDRYKNMGGRDGEPWAHLIRGTLFETRGIEMRRKIVEAHSDLIASERIKDLESIVDGLTQQLKKAQVDLDACRDRVRYL